MAVKMTVSYVCDQCGYEDTDKSAMYHYVVEVPTTKRGIKRMEMDLCAGCAESLDNAYIDVWRPEVKGGLTGIVVKPSVPKPAFEDDPARPTVCKICGFQAKSWNGLLVHAKRKGH